MKKLRVFGVGVVAVIVVAVVFFRIDPFLSGTDMSGFHIARVKRTTYQNFLGKCPPEAVNNFENKYAGSVCSMDGEKGFELLSARSTAWAVSDDNFPMINMHRVDVNSMVYVNSPNAFNEFIPYAFSDMRAFWGAEMAKVGLAFKPPQIRIAQNDEMLKITREAKLGRGVDWILYDRTTQTLIVPDPSLWGVHMKSAGQMSKIELTALMSFGFARSVQESVGIDDSASQHRVNLQALYLTGIYLGSRFPGMNKGQLPKIDSSNFWLGYGYQTLDPGYPGPLQSVYSLEDRR